MIVECWGTGIEYWKSNLKCREILFFFLFVLRCGLSCQLTKFSVNLTTSGENLEKTYKNKQRACHLQVMIMY